jgi:integrase
MGGRRSFGTVRQLPSGRWQVRYRDAAGVRHSKTFATKNEATRHLAAVETDTARGAWIDPRRSHTTFAIWIEQWRRTTVGLAPATQARYDSLLRTHLLPSFGNRPLLAITKTAVKEWHAKLLARVNDGELSVNTVAKTYRLLAKIMRDAVDAELIVASPCTLRGAGQDQVKEMRTATPEQVADLTRHVPVQYRAMILLAAWCGLRLGELAGLQRRDVDVLRRTVSIKRQLQWANRTPILRPPKTAAGRRTVAIPEVVVVALREHLTALGDADAEAFVFPSPDGQPLRSENFRQRVWHPAARAAGVEGLRFHDLRHAAGTMAATTPGATIKDVQARLGHASVAAAIRYQHAAVERDRLIADHLDAIASTYESGGAS